LDTSSSRRTERDAPGIGRLDDDDRHRAVVDDASRHAGGPRRPESCSARPPDDHGSRGPLRRDPDDGVRGSVAGLGDERPGLQTGVPGQARALLGDGCRLTPRGDAHFLDQLLSQVATSGRFPGSLSRRHPIRTPKVIRNLQDFARISARGGFRVANRGWPWSCADAVAAASAGPPGCTRRDGGQGDPAPACPAQRLDPDRIRARARLRHGPVPGGWLADRAARSNASGRRDAPRPPSPAPRRGRRARSGGRR
jgi:hypothetical protein